MWEQDRFDPFSHGVGKGSEGILEKVTFGLRAGAKVGVRQKRGGAQGENILGRKSGLYEHSEAKKGR